MKNWKYSTIAAILAMLILSSCSSAPRKAIEMSEVGEGVYVVSLPGDHSAENVQKYAINQFVKSKGYDSYDFVMTNKPGRDQYNFIFNVTVPGSIPVENMDEVRVVKPPDASTVIMIIGAILFAPVILLGIIFAAAAGI